MTDARGARAAAGEFIAGLVAGLVALAVGVAIASATRLPMEAALLTAAVACGGRRLWGQLGVLAIALAAGLSIGGHAVGVISAALGAGWLASFGEFSRSDEWSLGHLRGAARFVGAAALVLLAGQLLGWSPKGPLLGPVIGSLGTVTLLIIMVEFARNVRAASRSRNRPARRRAPARGNSPRFPQSSRHRELNRSTQRTRRAQRKGRERVVPRTSWPVGTMGPSSPSFSWADPSVSGGRCLWENAEAAVPLRTWRPLRCVVSHASGELQEFLRIARRIALPA